MIHLIKITAIILLALVMQKAECQTDTSLAAIVGNFGKIIAFTNQPYLHYTTVTKMNAIPTFEPNDTATLLGEFFKYKDNFYSNNGLEEIYIQDSFMVRVNHERKSIWISKIDSVTEKRMDMLPLSLKQLQVILKTYVITQTVLNNNIERMDFSEKLRNNNKVTTTSLGLEYNIKNFLPITIDIKATIRQPAEDGILTAIDNEHVDSTQLFAVIDGAKFLVRIQSMHLAFSNIDHTKETAMKMPSWRTVLDYDSANNEFLATAAYISYEVTPTF